ncbi:MAG: DUF2680 domain-containing protein [Syntrophomonadaceae bacterium]|nr:DUF2680 domain-containing protein [Syntrophomonadaceae bacterium]
MKRTMVFVLVLIMVIGIASLAYAGDTSNQVPNRANIPQLVISEKQKAQMTSLMTQMLELKKEVLKDNLKNGVITQEQYQVMEQRINARLEAVKSGNLTPGMFQGRGKGKGLQKEWCSGNGAGRWQRPQTQS